MTEAPRRYSTECAITVPGHLSEPKKSRRQKSIERVAQEAERKQRFAKQVDGNERLLGMS